MADISLTGFDKLEAAFDGYVRGYEKMAKAAIEAAVPILVSKEKQALSTAIANHPRKGERLSTGSLVGSVEPTEVKKNDLGYYSVARPTGRNAHGTRNGAIAAYLEYGTPKMAPSPWRESCKNLAENDCVKAMEEEIDRCIEESFGYD